MTIDLNADLGEGCGDDEALLAIVTSANIACGAHAGDRDTMRETILAAMRSGVSIGAHPSYPDRENFGRVAMDRTPQQIEEDVALQIRELDDCAQACGARLRHVKAHGALYNLAARDMGAADAISRAVRAFDPTLAVVGLENGAQMTSARKHGLRAIGEVFADRRYDPNGFLVPRSHARALIDDEAEAVAQALGFVRERRGETLCLHGDGPHAMSFARAIRSALDEAGVTVRGY
jgi:UPF0271 protein